MAIAGSLTGIALGSMIATSLWGHHRIKEIKCSKTSWPSDAKLKHYLQTTYTLWITPIISANLFLAVHLIDFLAVHWMGLSESDSEEFAYARLRS